MRPRRLGATLGTTVNQRNEEDSMAPRVAINGFGRTGRAAFRAAYASGAEHRVRRDQRRRRRPSSLAQLLRHDSVYGPFPGIVEAREHSIVVDGIEIATPAASDPAWLPWGELGIDVVIESTGKFRKRLDAQKHLAAGAQKVVISAPADRPGRDRGARCQLRRGLRRRAARDHLERVLHHELPRTGRQGPARGPRHQATA